MHHWKASLARLASSILPGMTAKTPTTATQESLWQATSWVCHPSMPCAQSSTQKLLAVKTSGNCSQDLHYSERNEEAVHLWGQGGLWIWPAGWSLVTPAVWQHLGWSFINIIVINQCNIKERYLLGLSQICVVQKVALLLQVALQQL